LPSTVSTASASLKEMEEQAGRLHSTILSYWVSDDATFVWVMQSGEAVRFARIPVTWKHLTDLVNSVWPLSEEDKGQDKLHAHQAKVTRGGEVEFPSRGQVELKATQGQKDHWRELYRLLIEPVETYLPSREGSRITIIPNGPLFALPFAGLRDAHGRYLLERYTLEYSPSISVLKFTGARPEANSIPHFLLIGDPAGMQKLDLPPLPGSRKEVAEVARQLPSDRVSVLTGEDARLDAVRSTAARSAVIHFATHGIVDDKHPFESFLALSDGKLTTRDVYGLNLTADLIFLSACRTGMGKVSGDGVLGFTRAFLYAGTRSVVATLWDVADEPTASLVENFYKGLIHGGDKAQALRSAQLSVLAQLRAGRMKVATPLGPLTLPENPVFWASFVLIGEP
jgi:CHAT domain-containing protein